MRHAPDDAEAQLAKLTIYEHGAYTTEYTYAAGLVACACALRATCARGGADVGDVHGAAPFVARGNHRAL